MDQRSARANLIVFQCKLEVVAPQRIEARFGSKVGHAEGAVHRQVAVVEAPASVSLTEQQLYFADRRSGVGEGAADSASAERALQAGRVEGERRGAPPEADGQVGGRETLADDLRRVRAKLHWCIAEAAGEPGVVEPRRDAKVAVRRLRHDRRPNRAD